MLGYAVKLERALNESNRKIGKLKERISGYRKRIKALCKDLKHAQDSKKAQKEKYESLLSEKEAEIRALSVEVAHLKAVAAHDGTNTGIPTSGTPIGKRKVIPNSRRGSGKERGGQPGHEKHSMKGFDASEIDERVCHAIDAADLTCSKCGAALHDTGEVVSKDEFDIIIKTVKRRHEYNIYECADCGRLVHIPIDRSHKEQNQYGPSVQAMALSLMTTGNVPVNKVRMLISGMTGNGMQMSEGLICKLLVRAADTLSPFVEDLRMQMIGKDLVYWDDTVIMVKADRACIRFYGDETVSYYTAHMHKNMDSLLEDNILPLLTSNTTVMHDHNMVNYNDRFCFRNIECNQHLQRDLQMIMDDFPKRTWAGRLKEMISSTIKERKDLIAAGIGAFPEKRIAEFDGKLDECLKTGLKESEKDTAPYQKSFEKTLLARIGRFRDNYFLWVRDFRMPTTDNLSERGLRSIKSHMKISGQFDNERTARNYAVVKTYVETCRKNNINEMEALNRLCSGNPYTVAEIFS